MQGIATNAKLNDITNAVLQNINQLCQCGLSAECITEGAFQCFDNSEQQQVTFRARLHGTAQVTSSQLLYSIFGEFCCPARLHHCCTRFTPECWQKLSHRHQFIWWSTVQCSNHSWKHCSHHRWSGSCDSSYSCDCYHHSIDRCLHNEES